MHMRITTKQTTTLCTMLRAITCRLRIELDNSVIFMNVCKVYLSVTATII